jgi:Tfp pilus assembly protein PilO
MPDLRKTRRNLTVAIAALVVADIVAAGILFSPLVGSAESRREQIRQLTAELARKTHDVQPLHDMPTKMTTAQGQIGDFYKDRFAGKDSELLTELGKLASANGVRIQQANYKEEDADIPGVVPVALQVSFSGDYLQLVRFINTMERSKMFFTVDSVDLAGEGTGTVRLQIGLHSYLRGA